jgi:hypothetical protein
VTVSVYRRVRLVLILALCAMWVSTPLIAEICSSAAPQCHRHAQMPCCPPAGGDHNCAPTLCPAQASQRAVRTQPIRNLAKARPMVVPIRTKRPGLHEPVRELVAGLHYSPPVFRLKDDFRI